MHQSHVKAVEEVAFGPRRPSCPLGDGFEAASVLQHHMTQHVSSKQRQPEEPTLLPIQDEKGFEGVMYLSESSIMGFVISNTIIVIKVACIQPHSEPYEPGRNHKGFPCRKRLQGPHEIIPDARIVAEKII